MRERAASSQALSRWPALAGGRSLSLAGRRPAWGCARHPGAGLSGRHSRQTHLQAAATRAAVQAAAPHHRRPAQPQRSEAGDLAGGAAPGQRVPEQPGRELPQTHARAGATLLFSTRHDPRPFPAETASDGRRSAPPGARPGGFGSGGRKRVPRWQRSVAQSPSCDQAHLALQPCDNAPSRHPCLPWPVRLGSFAPPKSVCHAVRRQPPAKQVNPSRSSQPVERSAPLRPGASAPRFPMPRCRSLMPSS